MEKDFEDFKKRIKAIKEDSKIIKKQTEKEEEERPNDILGQVENLIQQFTEADSQLKYKRFTNGFHIVYANAINLRIVFQMTASTILIYTSRGSMYRTEVYNGPINKEEILNNLKETLINWYRSLF